MRRFLFQVSYTADGVRGLLKDGGSKRRAVVEQLTSSVGGKLEAFYYAFGEDDVFVIAELPDDESAAAVALSVGASGAANIRTIVLMTPEQIDAATKKSPAYTPPGG